ncbi:hypothetical protein QN239_26825 [Mycolicibacterium sp. Y3]
MKGNFRMPDVTVNIKAVIDPEHVNQVAEQLVQAIRERAGEGLAREIAADLIASSSRELTDDDLEAFKVGLAAGEAAAEYLLAGDHVAAGRVFDEGLLAVLSGHAGHGSTADTAKLFKGAAE